MSDSAQVHGCCISLDGQGVLFTGASGCGKSDLCLRLMMEAGAQLVADDRVILEVQEGKLIARAPDRLRGMLEVRGIGVVHVPYAASVPLHLAVEAVTEEPERLPEPEEVEYAGILLPRIRLNLLHASAGAKIRVLLGDARSVL